MNKLVLIILLLSLTACNSTVPFGADKETFETKKLKYSDNLKVKAKTKEDILHAETTDICVDEKVKGFCDKTIKAVSYVYKSKAKAGKEVRYLRNGKLEKEAKKDSKNKAITFGAEETIIEENLDKRTYNSITFDLNATTSISDIYSGASFYYEDPEWVYVEYATTSLEAYNDQMDAIFATSSELGWIEWDNIFSKKTIKYLLETKIAKAACGDSGGVCYPVAGDSTIYNQSSNTWSTVHNAVSGSLRGGDTAYMQVYDATGASAVTIERFFATIDTAAIDDSAIITSANFYLRGTSIYGTVGSRALNIFSSSHSDTVVGGDFDLFGTTPYSTAINYSSFNTTGYNTFSFNDAGKAAISLTGKTKICALEATYDAANSAPTESGQVYISFNTSGYTGTTRDPYLEITYTTGGGATPLADGLQIVEF